MATLVLTAVGAVVGGPVGAAIGAVAGQAIDAQLFRPKARQGPRLGELAVQTSSYGTQIPKLFGTMRVAGSVIWATDLREERNRTGGGKGRAATVQYSYSASFAVALSARPIRAVRRIWADGKLLRGAAGDFKTETGYRLHRGTEEQGLDPLIGSAEGEGAAPAYRGLAYAVFEDFQLADYGNRIPSLTFEVEADAGAVAIGTIAEVLSEGEVIGGAEARISGFAATGDSLRGAIEALGDLSVLSLVDDGQVLRMASAAGEAVMIHADELGATAEDGTGGPTEIVRGAAGNAPDELTLAYYDRERDFQAGLQRAHAGAGRAGPGNSSRSERRAVAAAIDAGAAKRFAEDALAALRAGRMQARVHMGWRHADIRPGATVRVSGLAGTWRVERWTLEAMVTRLDLVRLPGSSASGAPASPGRPIAEPDLPHGPTLLRLHDLPLFGDQLLDQPLLVAAAAGPEPGWRRAGLMLTLDDGASWRALGSTAAPAVMGKAIGVLGGANAALLDEVNMLDLDLISPAMWLESASDQALGAGANLALLGEEIIQFGRAEPLGSGRFRLSRLLRGRMGTEWASVSHAGGEDFLLLDRDGLTFITLPAAALGGEARLLATGMGDGADGAEARAMVLGEVLRPPAPVHLRVERIGPDLLMSWTRRSRAGWTWLSGSDVPLAEDRERYRVVLTSDNGASRSFEVGEARLLYTAGEQAADGLSGAIRVEVAQIGTHGPSRPATLAPA